LIQYCSLSKGSERLNDHNQCRAASENLEPNGFVQESSKQGLKLIMAADTGSRLCRTQRGQSSLSVSWLSQRKQQQHSKLLFCCWLGLLFTIVAVATSTHHQYTHVLLVQRRHGCIAGDRVEGGGGGAPLFNNGNIQRHPPYAKRKRRAGPARQSCGTTDWRE